MSLDPVAQGGQHVAAHNAERAAINQLFNERTAVVTVASPTSVMATDTASVVEAQNRLRALGKGVLYFQPGTYVLQKETVQIETDWHLRGPGAKLRLGNGQNGDLVRTVGYAAAVSANDGRGPHTWSIVDLKLDGNRANNTSGDCLKIYGFNFSLTDMEIFGARGKGIVSKWREGSAFDSAISAGDVGFCESFVSRLKVHDNTGGGVDWDGPHDPAGDSVYVYFNGSAASATAGAATSVGVRFGPEAYAPEWRGLHIYGNHHQVGLLIEAPYALLTALQSEGAQEVQVRIKAGGTRINGGHIYNAGDSAIMATARGIEVGHGGVFVDAVDIKTTLTNCYGGALVPIGEGTACRYDLSIFQGQGTVFPSAFGTPNPSRQITYSQSGGAALGDPGGRGRVAPGNITGAITGAIPVYDGNNSVVGYQAVYDVINPAVSLLPNPNFETDVSGWTPTQDAGVVGSFVRSTFWKSQGSASGYYTATNNGTGEAAAGPISDVVNATAGHTYKASISAKLLDEVIPGDFALVVSFLDSSNAFISNVFTTVYGDAGLKTLETAKLLAPAGTARINVRAQVQVGPGETKRFYIDNVLLYDIVDIGVVPTPPTSAGTSRVLGTSLFDAGNIESIGRGAGWGDKALGSGTLWLQHFYAPATSPDIVSLAYNNRNTGASPDTLVRLALFTVASDGALTKVAQTAKFLPVGTYYEQVQSLSTVGGFPASYTVVAGQQYALGILAVGTTVGEANGTDIPGHKSKPYISRRVASQTDIANTYSGASQTTWYEAVYLYGLRAGGQ